VPNPPRTPEDDVLLPGETISRLLPNASICSDTRACAPSPRPTVRITEVMPMTMPSMVNADRSRCARMASRPLAKVSLQFTTPPLPLRGVAVLDGSLRKLRSRLRRLRCTGALRGLGGVVSADRSLRKLRS